MSESATASPGHDPGRDLARRVAAATVGWVRQNPPGGRWRTWMFTADATAEAIGPRVDGLHLSPGSPTEYFLLESVVRRTSGIRSTGRGLALAFPASLRPGGRSGSELTAEPGHRAPVVTPRHSGADPARGARPVLAVAVQLDTPGASAVIVDRDDRTDRPFDPAGPDGAVVFPAPDLVPAFLRRAVLGETGASTADLPPAGRLLVQGWVASVIRASMEHGSTSADVEDALDGAPTLEDVRTATVPSVHDMVVAGQLPGVQGDLARWCGPELTARVVAGVYGRLPDLLRYADEHWPRLGATLGRRTRELLEATSA